MDEQMIRVEHDDNGRLKQIKVCEGCLLLTKEEAERLMDTHIRMRDLIREMYRCFVATRDDPWMASERAFVERTMAELGIEADR